MAQDTDVKNLIINKLTRAQYESIANPDPTQLYFITDEVISSTDVTNALGYTPYNSSNPNGYTSNEGTVTSVNNVQPVNGNVTISIPDVSNFVTNSSLTTTLGDYAPLYSNVDFNSLTLDNSATFSVNTDAETGDKNLIVYAPIISMGTNDYSLDFTSNGVLINGNEVATQTWVTNQGYTTNVGTVTSVNNIQPDTNGNVTISTRNVGEVITSTLPLTDAGLHLLDGSLILGGGIYQGFVDYIADLYNDTKVYNPSAFTVIGNPTITDDGIASGFSSSNRLVSTINIPNTYNKLEILSPIYNVENSNNTENYVVSYANAFTFSCIYGLVAIRAYNVTESNFCLFMDYTGIARPSVGDSVQGKIVYENNTCTAYYKNITTGSDWIPIGRLEGATSPTTPFPMSGVMNIGAKGSNMYYQRGWIDLKQFSITVDGVEVFNGSTPANYFTTESDWQNSVTQYGSCGKFVYDSTNNTVRLPKVSDILQSTTDINALGNLIEAGLPNIKNEFNGGRIFTTNDYNGGVVAPFIKAPTPAYLPAHSGTGNQTSIIGFDASLLSTIYGNSNTVQPQTIKAFVYIVIANSTKTSIQVDIDEIATDLNNKAGTDLANVTDTGKILMSGMGMPSDSYIDLTLGASGSTYTAPTNGWFYVHGVSYDSLGFHSITIFYGNTNYGDDRDWDSPTVRLNTYDRLTGIAGLIPVAKGQTIRISLGNVTLKHVQFIYAQGAESEVN